MPHRPKPKERKPPLTHFLSLPLVTTSSRSALQASLEQFLADIATCNEDVPEYVSPKAVRPVGTLHLTLGVMSLETQEKVDGAVELLRALDLRQILRDAQRAVLSRSDRLTPAHQATIVGMGPSETNVEDDEDEGGVSLTVEPGISQDQHAPLTVTLDSLSPMHAPTKTSILYSAPFDPTGRLLPFCQRLRDTFSTAGYVLPDDRPLKLHATIVNTIYASGGRLKSGSGHGKSRGKIHFDATGLSQRYRGFQWAKDIRIENVAICKMGARKVLNESGNLVDEKYEEIAAKALP